MELRQFFLRFFHLKGEDTLREEMFALTYCMEGMPYDAVERMPSVDRVWYLKRLEEQIVRESEEVKKVQKKAPPARKPKRRRR